MDEPTGQVRVFGIRHHGPGSARSLKAALENLRPDALLVEGPPDADALLPLVLSEAMQPPVVLLVYAPSEPAYAAYYPFAEYSPEWQAIRYGLSNGLPVRMLDLPQSVQMALAKAEAARTGPGMENQASGGSAASGNQPGYRPDQPPAPENSAAEDPDAPVPLPFDTTDPLRMLAEAAGYSDGEQWWEHMVEQYRGAAGGAPEDLFAAILEAISALREAAPPDTDPAGALREAAMRQVIRDTLAGGYRRIAVVCGAWHAPALASLENAAQDARLLKGMPRMEVQATWVPWTEARLTRASGYGAGIESPGWYSHLWSTGEDITIRWMIRAARLLGDEGLDISPAHAIEAVRLAEALAALRGRPLPGLPELNEAMLSVFCFGNPAPLRLIGARLMVGMSIGSVPPETPAAPLQQDFNQQIRRLRLPLESSERLLNLDLRRPLDQERSHLLHRLSLLGVPWGRSHDAALQNAARGRSGTFHETWKLTWMPELAVLLIEAGQWGNTIAEAASTRVCQLASQAVELGVLTGMIEDALLAELPDAISQLMTCLRALSAVSAEVRRLMGALPPLINALRYGNVRQTDTAMLAQVVDELVARTCIGLPGACSGLDEDAAAELFDDILKTNDALARLAEPAYQEAWQRALAQLLDAPGTNPLIAGRACRILLDSSLVEPEDASRRLGLALSPAVDAQQAAAWLEGFLSGSGQLLIHDSGLLELVDRWLSSLPEAAFGRLLPLLRRTFATFARPERRGIGERLRKTPPGKAQALAAGPPGPLFDQSRADAVLPLVARLLGIHPGARRGSADFNLQADQDD